MISFDEWMSGRHWLGDKAPQEGFYGRYNNKQLETIKAGFHHGSGLQYITSLPIDDVWLYNWAFDVGTRLNKPKAMV